MIWLEYREEDGLVVNAVEWDGETPYEPPAGTALVEPGESGAWIGWSYQGGDFLPPEPEPESEGDGSPEWILAQLEANGLELPEGEPDA